MSNAKDNLALVLIILVGVLLAFSFSAVLDDIAFQEGRRLGTESTQDQAFIERYRVQAVEAHILGTGTAILITMGLLALWIKRRPGEAP